MEMGWMETIQLLGFDVLVMLLTALGVLDVVERAVHPAWRALQANRSDSRSKSPQPVEPSRVSLGGIRHV